MVPALHQKLVWVIDPVAIVDNASWTTIEIDTLGYDYAQVVFRLAANDIAMTALKVQETDTTGTGEVDITGADFSVTTVNDTDGVAFALPSATDDNTSWVWDLNLKGRKRFLKLIATNGDGTAGGFAAAVAILSRAKAVPVTAAERGCKTIARP